MNKQTQLEVSSKGTKTKPKPATKGPYNGQKAKRYLILTRGTNQTETPGQK